MSLVSTGIILINAFDIGRFKDGSIKEADIRQMTVEAIVDTGAWTLVINEEVKGKLGLEVVGSEPSTLADGTKAVYDMAGPLEVRWKNRRVLCDALVMPDANYVLLGAIPLEAMDLTVNPRREVVGAHGDEVVHRV